MSLRGFHIVFITVTMLLSIFLIVWGFRFAPSEAASTGRTVGILGIIGLFVLPVYGVYFYRKAKKLII